MMMILKGGRCKNSMYYSVHDIIYEMQLRVQRLKGEIERIENDGEGYVGRADVLRARVGELESMVIWVESRF